MNTVSNKQIPNGFYETSANKYLGMELDAVTARRGLYVIGDIKVMAVRVAETQKYWIIPEDAGNDHFFTALGPFDTPEEALLVLKLHS